MMMLLKNRGSLGGLDGKVYAGAARIFINTIRERMHCFENLVLT